MLIDERIALRIPDELDVVFELIATTNASIQSGHSLGILDGTRPQEDRERLANRVLAYRQPSVNTVRVTFTGTGIGARQPDLPRQKRHHGNSGRLRFAIHAALRPPTLRDKGGLSGRDFTR